MFKRPFLAVVGFTYVYLSLWCSFRPKETSQLVGFELIPGSGQSEFLTVYGGLEMGLAIYLLLPLIRKSLTDAALLNCLIIHGCLVLFRSVGFVLYADIQPLTWKLAAGEWAIFIIATLLYLQSLSREKASLQTTHAGS